MTEIPQTVDPSPVCGEAHQPGENDLNMRPSVTVDAPVEIFSTTSSLAIAPYPGPGHHKSGCAGGKILNQIDVGKKIASRCRAVFIDTS